MDYYYIVTFQLLVDGQFIGSGKCGVQSPTPDHRPNQVKQVIKTANRERYPGKAVEVILSEKKVTKEIYEHQAPTFDYVVGGNKGEK